MFDTELMDKLNLRRELMKLSAGAFYDVMAALRGPDGKTDIVGALKWTFTAHIRRMAVADSVRFGYTISHRSALSERAEVLKSVAVIRQVLIDDQSPQNVYVWHYLEHVRAAIIALRDIQAYHNECAFLLKQAEGLIAAVKSSNLTNYL